MRSAARPILAVVLVTVLSGAALHTLGRLGEVDPRGRASWTGKALAFDGTPRDVTVFLPACDAQAIVLHPASPASGRVEAEFFVAASDGSALRAGTASAMASGDEPVTLSLGAVRPAWRAPLVIRLRALDVLLTLDLRRPITIAPASSSRLGTLACAFDGGGPEPAWAVVVALLLVVMGSAGIAAAWLRRAGGDVASRTTTSGAVAVAMLLAGATLVTYLLVVPPFEPPDELAHFQYARFVATTGALPSRVPEQGSEWRAPSYEFVQQPLYYLGAAALLKVTGLDAPGPALTLNPRSRLQPRGTEPTIFQHGAAPVNATGHRGLRLLRLVSLLMALATTWLTAKLLTTVTDDALVIATVAGGLGLIPQWCAVMGAVSTDPPATLLAAAATLVIVRVALGRRDTGWLLLTGVLIGAAYAVKATTVFLVPMAMAACVVPRSIAVARRAAATGRLAGPERSRGGEASLPAAEARALARVGTAAVRSMLLVGAGVALAAGWIHLRAWFVFGDPSARAFKRAVLEAGGFVPTRGPMPWTAEFWTQMRVMVFEPFWARFGSLGAGPFPGSRVWLPYAAASVMLVALAFAGTIGTSVAAWRRLRQAPSTPAGTVVFAALVCGVGLGVGLVAWLGVNLIPQADMVVHWTPRHILPLTAPAALLVAAGLERLRHAPALVARAGSAVTGGTVAALAVAWLIVLRNTILMFHFGY